MEIDDVGEMEGGKTLLWISVTPFIQLENVHYQSICKIFQNLSQKLPQGIITL